MVEDAVRRRCHAADQVLQSGSRSRGWSCPPLRTTRTTTGRKQRDHRTTTGRRREAGAKVKCRGPYTTQNFQDTRRCHSQRVRLVPIPCVFQHSPHAPTSPVGAASGDDDDQATTLLQQRAQRQRASTAGDRRQRQAGDRRPARQATGTAGRQQARARQGLALLVEVLDVVRYEDYGRSSETPFHTKNRPCWFLSGTNNCQAVGHGQSPAVTGFRPGLERPRH